MTIVKDSRPITSLDDWKVRAGPKASYQWVEGRSAMEAARAWLDCGAGMPQEVLGILAAHPAFGPIRHWEAEPEVRLRFDSFPGEPRNSDLCVVAEDSRGSYILAVEAKADETFGETLADAMLAALDRKDKNPRSNGIKRIEQLLTALFTENTGSSGVRTLRYQLLTATAGALCEAERRGFSRAVLLIQEFITSKTEDDKHKANARDFEAYVTRLASPSVPGLGSGGLVGPIRVPGAPLIRAEVELFVGKVSRNLRGAAPAP